MVAVLAPVLVLVLLLSVRVFAVCSAVFICLTVLGAAHLIYVFNHNLWCLVLLQSAEKDGGAHLNKVQQSMVKTVCEPVCPRVLA